MKILVVILAVVCLSLGARGQDVAPEQITKVLSAQAAAWNRGDIDGFMEGYAKLPTLRFASGGTVTYGWQPTLERYRKHYPDRAAMGALTFSDLDITALAPDSAIVFGRWRLKTDKAEPNGFSPSSSVGWRPAGGLSRITPPPPTHRANGGACRALNPCEYDQSPITVLP